MEVITSYYYYGNDVPSRKHNSLQILRVASAVTVWPGDYTELKPEKDYGPEQPLLIEPNTQLHNWVVPQITACIDNTIRVRNQSPICLGKHGKSIKVTPLVDTEEIQHLAPEKYVKGKKARKQAKSWEDAILIDPDKQLPPQIKREFAKVNYTFSDVFSPDQHMYNDACGPFEAVINMGSVKPPQRKGRVPQYARDRLVELQEKFDELEAAGVFVKPELEGTQVENVSPSFLVRKSY